MKVRVRFQGTCNEYLLFYSEISTCIFVFLGKYFFRSIKLLVNKNLIPFQWLSRLKEIIAGP